ncbi:hypothetical protein [Deinococcus sp. QL22]|uniref:DUF7352 domain-containing protein n=1 Tax=Deinococcus sp. QL22 TaxID=2939437 RepID=UPI002017A3E3|nr:hypothetical protein [Deinococcus sp. QL22]UQN10395.1 hypothetical protein M1R55_30035 [Deinococcus sp. QL22]UQN10529.1 hypothetical protein M1R55_29360 [Deinococcus sp. QL22]
MTDTTECPPETIYKYVLRPVGHTTALTLPTGAVPVLVGEQGGVACLWVRHAQFQPFDTEMRVFRMAGTGDTLLAHERHVGSFQSGPYVWHVVEVLTSKDSEPPSARAQAISAALAKGGILRITPEQAQVALDWRQDD